MGYYFCLNVILFAPQLLSVQSLRQQENANQPVIADLMFVPQFEYVIKWFKKQWGKNSLLLICLSGK